MEVGVLQSHLIYPSGAAIGAFAGGFAYTNDAKKATSGSYSAYGTTWTTNDVIGVALDADSGSLTFYKNGVSQGVAYTIAAGTILFSGLIPAIAIYRNTGITQSAVFNFGQRDFEYTPPTGFKALNTANLPAPTIKKPGSYFDVSLYTGNGSAQTVTNSGGFTPDLVWHKGRSVGYSHSLVDSVRGNSNVLFSDTTSAEQNPGAQLDITTNGFIATYRAANLANNQSSATYVGWQWKAGGSGSSNTAGSITSTVSANPTAGFSIITYSGNSTNNSTIGHGLGVAPVMIITKVRTGATNEGWPVWHQAFGNTQYVQLNQTHSVATDSNIYGGSNNTAPTSTVYSVGPGGVTNTSGRTYVAYCFAEVEGYSKFGSYTGNGSSDGPFVYTGFRPAWIMIKQTSPNVGSWQIWDTQINQYNATYGRFNADRDLGEQGSLPIDILSNGFKIRHTDGATNESGYNFICIAFAEHPFGGSGVSPATAR